MSEWFYEKPVVVILSCNGDYCLEDEVKFVNIYEDTDGSDVLVFVCPVCGNQHESKRLV